VKDALDIAIVGYGIAGIAAAIHLRRSGHRIRHFERSDPPIAGGAGMLLHPAGMRELDKLGVLAAAVERGAPIRRICAETVQGRSLLDFRYDEVVAGQHALGIQRGTLHRLMSSVDSGRDAVFARRNVVTVEPETGFLADAERVRHGPFDLIVLADGMHSALRSQVVSCANHDRRADSAALVGLLDDPRRLAGDRLAQYFDGTRHLSIWPVGCAFVGDQNRCSIAINISLSEAEMLRDETRRRTFLARHCPGLRALLDDGVEDTALHIYTYRDVELSQSCVGRVAIIGDAAHSMSPQLGTGAQLAMEDAATLANVIELHGDVSDALRAFMHIRMPQLRRHHLASRWLTPLFKSDSRTMAFLRDQLFASAMNSTSAKLLAHALFS
jgi:2-polyprenyl-6-methoxyphenol hydroxylase-like FAD-dependent oxidoreductase